METFGEILREIRIDTGMGLRELARLINKSPGYLSDVENGRVPPPSEETIVNMARALKADKQRLLSVAKKVDPEISEYLTEKPVAADFLRTAKSRDYNEEDWLRLGQLAEIAKLGKKGDEK